MSSELTSKGNDTPLILKPKTFTDCFGDEDVFCPKCDINHCNCFYCMCVYTPIAHLYEIDLDGLDEKSRKRAEKVMTFNKMIDAWGLKKNEPMTSLPPSPLLRHSPDHRYFINTINKAIKKAQDSGKSLSCIYSKFVYYGDVYYLYNHPQFGWTTIQPKYNSISLLSVGLRSRLVTVVECYRWRSGAIRTIHFPDDKLSKARDEIVASVNIYRAHKIIEHDGQKYYLIDFYNDDWQVVNLETGDVFTPVF
jgi:hypothetical protein